MHVLVTGGLGYIGSALLPQLLDAEDVADVSVLDSLSSGSPRSLVGTGISEDCDLAFQRGDVREYGDVESAMRDIDSVVHLAAITGATSTHDRRQETFAVNLEGTKNVLTAAAKQGVENVVFASSCNNYGRTASTAIDEDTETDPLNPYAETKVEAESLLADAVDDHDFQATALRMSTVYGYAPAIRFNLVVNHFVFRALTGRPLTVYGDGSNWRPFIHVEDAARAFSQAARNPDEWSRLVYNVGDTDENYRISEIADVVKAELDADLEITYLEDEHPGPSYHVNFDRVSETGFETAYTLREGVRELADAFGRGVAE